MMIDLAKEELIAVRDVPSRLPPRPNGKRLHVSAVYRWILRGVDGVVLESIRIGGTTYTSVEALQRFSDGRSRPPARRIESYQQASLARQGQIKRAHEAVLRTLGIEKKSH